MRKQLCSLAQGLGVEAVDGGVLLGKRRLVRVLVLAAKHAQPLRQQAVQLQVRPLLAAALNHHVGELGLVPRWQIEAQQLVCRFLVGQRGHDGQIHGAAESNKVCASHVLNHLLAITTGSCSCSCCCAAFLFLIAAFITAAFITAAAAAAAAAALIAQDFTLQTEKKKKERTRSLW